MGQRIQNQGGTLNIRETTAVQRGPVGNGIGVLQGSFFTILGVRVQVKCIQVDPSTAKKHCFVTGVQLLQLTCTLKRMFVLCSWIHTLNPHQMAAFERMS